MSISTTVFLERARLPKPLVWADHIRAAGFPMDLDAAFDVETFSGFLPASYGGKSAGFEYFFSPVVELDLDDTVAAQLGLRDVSISFVTHSDMRELASAAVAAAVLCAHADGILLDEESGELITANDALASARELLESIAGDLR